MRGGAIGDGHGVVDSSGWACRVENPAQGLNPAPVAPVRESQRGFSILSAVISVCGVGGYVATVPDRPGSTVLSRPFSNIPRRGERYKRKTGA